MNHAQWYQQWAPHVRETQRACITKLVAWHAAAPVVILETEFYPEPQGYGIYVVPVVASLTPGMHYQGWLN